MGTWLEKQTCWAQRRQSATFVKPEKCFCSYLLGKIAFAALSSCGECSAAEEFCGRRSQEVTCFTRQPTDSPPTWRNSPLSAEPHGEGEQLKSTTATNVGWRFGTRVNRCQNLVRLGRSLITPIISAPMEAFYEWMDKVFSSICTSTDNSFELFVLSLA